MPRTDPRLAAGAGLVSVLLVLAGAGAAVASADPGHSRGSDRGSNSGGGDSRRGHPAGGPDGSRDARPGAGGHGERNEPPQVRVGSGRGDTTARLSPSDSSNSRGGSDSGGGSDSPRATADFTPPRVTFGNGREPGTRITDPEPRWQAPAPQPAVPAPPPASPPPAPAVQAPSWVDRIATPPTIARQFVVAPAAEVTDPLWGIAGLLLIPAAGAALGYRQARAAQTAEGLNRFSGRS